MTSISEIKIEHDYVVVTQNKLKHTKTASGLITAEIDKWKDTWNGTVVAISEESPYKLTVKVGDTVYFKYSETKGKIILDEKEYLFLSEKDCLGYLSDN